jgi:hypothetical protein
MNIIILTPVRLFGEGLATCISRRPEMSVHAVISDLESLRVQLSSSDVQLVLVDVTQGLDLFDLRAISQWNAGLGTGLRGRHSSSIWTAGRWHKPPEAGATLARRFRRFGLFDFVV